MPEGMRLGTGTVCINGEKFVGPVTDFTYETEEVEERFRDHLLKNLSTEDGLTFTCKISRIQLLNLMGIWQWVFDNCPSGRIKHFMLHGSDRVKFKNYQHAIKLICRKVKKV